MRANQEFVSEGGVEGRSQIEWRYVQSTVCNDRTIYNVVPDYLQTVLTAQYRVFSLIYRKQLTDSFSNLLTSDVCYIYAWTSAIILIESRSFLIRAIPRKLQIIRGEPRYAIAAVLYDIKNACLDFEL